MTFSLWSVVCSYLAPTLGQGKEHREAESMPVGPFLGAAYLLSAFEACEIDGSGASVWGAYIKWGY